ncbi:MAG: thiamine-binding protein [Rhodanobacteraceae bacterium]|nr:MAG: thiamine-binding protein [Rhodanobacteraceae bacterium]
MLAAFSVWASGGKTGDSGHGLVADAVKVVRASGLPNHTDAMFTTVEGEWDEVFDVIHRATDAALTHGTRVDLIIKADIRPGHRGELTGKVARLEQAIAADGK